MKRSFSRRSTRIMTLGLVMLVGSIAQPWRLLAQAPTPAKGVKFAQVAESDLKEWLTYLSSDELQGRQMYTEGYGAASQYIADHLKSWGVKPLGDNGSYFQVVKLKGYKVTNNSSVTIEGAGGPKTFKNGDHVTFAMNAGKKQTVAFTGAQFVGSAAPAARHRPQGQARRLDAEHAAAGGGWRGRRGARWRRWWRARRSRRRRRRRRDFGRCGRGDRVHAGAGACVGGRAGADAGAGSAGGRDDGGAAGPGGHARPRRRRGRRGAAAAGAARRPRAARTATSRRRRTRSTTSSRPSSRATRRSSKRCSPAGRSASRISRRRPTRAKS